MDLLQKMTALSFFGIVNFHPLKGLILRCVLSPVVIEQFLLAGRTICKI